jgi:hypothetical protein
MRQQPVVFMWDGDHMVPQARYKRVCDRQFVVGEEYVLERVESRSMASHNQFFAAVNDAFDNLPEKLAASFPSAEHLRKWALIQTRHFEQREIEYDTQHDAETSARYARTEDIYARIKVERMPSGSGHGRWLLVIRKARSQSLGAMKKAEFEQSKRDVLDLLETMTEVPKGSLMKNAGRAA